MLLNKSVAVDQYTSSSMALEINLLLLLLPLALQPTVGFGLSNNTSPFVPIYHQLSPSSHSQHLKISFYFLLNSIHSTSRAGRLLAFTKYIYLVLFRPSSLNLSSLFLCSIFVTISFLLCGVINPTPNPQPGGPGYSFFSGSSPLNYLAWEALPVAYATASIALRIM
jgi:hypothetical protein